MSQTSRQRDGDFPTKMTRKIAKKIPMADDFIFANDCKQNRVLTYEYLPEITMLALEQILYIIIFVAFLLEIFAVLKIVYNKKEIEKKVKVPTSLKNYIMKEFLILLVVTAVFFVMSFRIIPIMIQSCKSEWKIAVIRIVNLAMVYLFYAQLVKSLKDKIKNFLMKTSGKFNKVFADEAYNTLKQSISQKAVETQEAVLRPILCKGKKVIPSVKDALNDPEVFNIDPESGKSSALVEAEIFCNGGELPSSSWWKFFS